MPVKSAWLPLLVCLLLLTCPAALADAVCTSCGQPIAAPSEVTAEYCVWTCANPDCPMDGRAEIRYMHTPQAQAVPCDETVPCAYGCGTQIAGQAHSFQTHVSNGDGTHRLQCDNPDCDQVLVEQTPCSGGTATCSSPAVCVICGGPYGEKDLSTHIWGDWVVDGDGMHRSGCLRMGCWENRRDVCTRWTVAAADGQSVQVCPVCGGIDGEPALVRVEGAEYTMVDGVLPDGALCVREGTLADGTRAMTVAFVSESGSVSTDSAFRVTVPLVSEQDFCLLRVGPGSVPTEIRHTFSSGLLTFQAQGPGVYLLLPEA